MQRTLLCIVRVSPPQLNSEFRKVVSFLDLVIVLDAQHLPVRRLWSDPAAHQRYHHHAGHGKRADRAVL